MTKRWLGLALLACFGACRAAECGDGKLRRGDICFQSPQLLATGLSPFGVSLVDLNEDSLLDLVTANQGEGTVGVLLGNGDGTFLPVDLVPVGTAPTDLLAVDLDSDGVLDLVTANLSGSLSVLLGVGDGAFLGSNEVVGLAQPQFLSAADINSDGFVDLVVSNAGGINSPVQKLLGNGDGTFQTPQTILSETHNAVSLARLNNDEHFDLVAVSGLNQQVEILLGDGQGAFVEKEAQGVGVGAFAVQVALLDRDKNLDVMVSNLADGTISILLGNGDGTFLSQLVFVVGTNPSSFTIGEVDKDRHTDVVVTNSGDGTPGGGSISVFRGTSLLLAEEADVFTMGTQPTESALGDVNGDSVLDLVVTDHSSSQVLVSLSAP